MVGMVGKERDRLARHKAPKGPADWAIIPLAENKFLHPLLRSEVLKGHEAVILHKQPVEWAEGCGGGN